MHHRELLIFHVPGMQQWCSPHVFYPAAQIAPLHPSSTVLEYPKHAGKAVHIVNANLPSLTPSLPATVLLL
jgi:hypothetical protein